MFTHRQVKTVSAADDLYKLSALANLAGQKQRKPIQVEKPKIAPTPVPKLSLSSRTSTMRKIVERQDR
jgi:hypothetical protein